MDDNLTVRSIDQNNRECVCVKDRSTSGKMSNPNPNVQAQYGQQPYSGAQGDQKMQTRQDFLNYRFSPEELRVIRECESEAFRYRSLPFSVGLGTATLLAVKNGVLKANPRFGPWPKVIAISFFGYIAGRLSYTKKCQEKMMALPNSQFAEMLRRNLQRRGKYDSNWDMGTQEAGVATALSLAPFKSTVDSYSDEFNQPNALNLDTNRPHFSSLDDVYTPTMEGKNDLNEDLIIPQRKNTVTYDELRRKNRDDHAKSHQYTPYAPNQSSAPAATLPPQASSPNSTPGSFISQPDNDRRRANLRARTDDDVNGAQKSGPKNRYGDIWSE